jgi:hypothetical protein
MDSYQAIYDAVRSRIQGGDVGEAVQQAIREQNWGHYVQQAAYEWTIAAGEQMRPCVVFKPELFQDGDHWCALFGKNLQEGIAGFGKTPAAAMLEFDKAWHSEAVVPIDSKAER